MNLTQFTTNRTAITPDQQYVHAATWLEINQQALEHNIQSYKAVIGSALLAPVIKSNAYGHGIEQVAKILDNHEAIGMICVVSLSEALTLRTLGIQKPLLVLSIIDADIKKTALHNITLVVYTIAMAEAMNNVGKEYNKKMSVHVKIDTGLARLGVPIDTALEFITTLSRMPYIHIEGIFTHFANSENKDQTYMTLQLSRFVHVLNSLEHHNIHIPYCHAASSAGITGNLNSHFNMARAGIGIYGLWPSLSNKERAQKLHPDFTLKPVLSWKTTIIQIKEIPAESYVGYDLTYQTKEATRIAVLPVGYWDGLSRKLSNKGVILVHNKQAPIIGRVAMNLTCINITGIDASIGDEVTLLGAGISADDLAAQCDTINYEITTRINPLLPRIIKL
ncbi:MAG: alanine racemase [Candidatus Dependentiae bacterium]|nr:alanine racemase [Candidatus Dependentiae bacterium]